MSNPSDHSQSRAEQFKRLKALLDEQETFPFDFTVKFIGRNTPKFTQGVAAFEKAHPILRVQSKRESSQGNHVALTYLFLARNSDHIISTLEQVALIEDLLVIL